MFSKRIFDVPEQTIGSLEFGLEFRQPFTPVAALGLKLPQQRELKPDIVELRS